MENANAWINTTDLIILVLFVLKNKLSIPQLEYARSIVGQILLINLLPMNVYAMPDMIKFGVHVENAKMDWSIMQPFHAALDQNLFVKIIKYITLSIKFAIAFKTITELMEYARHVQKINFLMQILKIVDLYAN